MSKQADLGKEIVELKLQLEIAELKQRIAQLEAGAITYTPCPLPHYPNYWHIPTPWNTSDIGSTLGGQPIEGFSGVSGGCGTKSNPWENSGTNLPPF